MYLLTFVTLVIALIGLYTQVLILQAQNVVQQPVVASALVAWHTAAVEMAHSLLLTNMAGYTALAPAGVCSLSATLPTGIVNYCPTPWSAPPGTPGRVALNVHGTLTVSPPPAAPPYYMNKLSIQTASATYALALPFALQTPLAGPLTTATPSASLASSYDTTDYQFNSVLFTTTVAPIQNYVVTYVLPPVSPPAASNPAGNIIGIPSNTQLNVTISGLLQQLGNTSVSSNFYGYINAAVGSATLQALGSGGFDALGHSVSPSYTLPSKLVTTAAEATALNGAIGLISIP